MYRVQLQHFEGPLDLLLFFIKRDELDIYDIPIAYITDQFLEYLHLMEELDLGVAAEFIYMTGTLMSIKARMMLPRDETEGDGIEGLEEDDPRYELVQSLLEYKRFKEMGDELRLMDDAERLRYSRGDTSADLVDADPAEGEWLKELTLYDLIAAYRQVMLAPTKEKPVHRVETVKTSIEEQEKRILALLRREGRQPFVALIAGAADRLTIVVTFLAVLEMIREGKLHLFLGDHPTDFHLDLPTLSETVPA